MPRIPGLRRVFRLEGPSRRVERDVDEELAFHFEMKVAELVAAGLSPAAARADAERRFGDVGRYRSELAAIDGRQLATARRAARWEAAAQDLRYALRSLGRQPGLVLAVVLTFALGIGANATMFGVLDQLLLRPPAHVVEPERITEIAAVWVDAGDEARQRSFSYPTYKAFRDGVTAFSHVALHTDPGSVSYGRGPDAREVQGVLVSASYFPLLGVRPQLGRFFRPEEDVEPVGAPVVVLGHRAWQRLFGGRPDVLGQTMELGQRRYTVIGVAPEGFAGTGVQAVDVWIPITAAEGIRFGGANWATQGGATWLYLLGRLRPGVVPAEASRQVAAVHRERGGEEWLKSPRIRLLATPLPEARRLLLGDEARVTTLLAAVSTFVLLIACANVANLLLARALRRRAEIAVRLALGISRRRLVGQLLAESLLLALAGGAAALLVTRWGGEFVRGALFADIAFADARVDARVLAFTAAATLLTGVLAGLVPALQASRPQLTEALKAGARQGGGRYGRTRAALLVTQAALSVVLLAGTGLFLRSLDNVSALRLGFDGDRLLVARVDLRGAGFAAERTDALFRQLEAAARAVPGVQRVAGTLTVPFTATYGLGVRVPGRDTLPRPAGGGPYYNAVSPGYFEAMGTRLLRGRGFTDADVGPDVRAVVVSETMARLWWPDGDPVGQCVTLNDDPACARVVGVAENVRRDEVIEEPLLFVYVPLAQVPWAAAQRLLVVRAAGDPARLVEPLRRALQTAAPALPYADVRPAALLYADRVRPWRLGATMFGVFGGLALLLAVIGLYGVVSYAVAQRARELGVRAALGAGGRDIAWLVLRQGLGVVAVGVGVGLAAVIAARPLVEPLLYEVSPHDPVVLAVVALALLGATLLACLLPARRAAAADPATALRAD